MSHQSNKNREAYKGHRSADVLLIAYRNNNNFINIAKLFDGGSLLNQELVSNDILKVNDMLDRVDKALKSL